MDGICFIFGCVAADVLKIIKGQPLVDRFQDLIDANATEPTRAVLCKGFIGTSRSGLP